MLRRLPLATWALIGACVSVFAGMVAEGASLWLVSATHLRGAGAMDAARVWEGEVWRLVTGMFVHGAVWHIGLNMWILWQVGRVLERLLGTPRFLLLYLVTGVTGFAASLVFHPGVSAGASGAIFGVVGGLLAVAIATRNQPVGRFLVRALLPFVAATLLIGFLLPFVDNPAHIGGLLMGILLGYGLLADPREAADQAMHDAGLAHAHEVIRLKRRFSSMALLVAVAVFAALVPTSLRPAFSPRYRVTRGLTAARAGDLPTARDHLAAAEKLAKEDGAVLLLRGRLLIADEPPDHDAARPFFIEALVRYDDDPETAFSLALMEAGARDTDETLFFDEALSAALCDVVTPEEAAPTATLLNNCAWLWLKADTAAVHDPARALPLAQRAVAQVEPDGPGPLLATFLHTLAEAQAQNGRPEEARIILERVLAEDMIADPFFESERARFAALAKKGAATPEPSPGGEELAEDAGQAGLAADSPQGAEDLHDAGAATQDAGG
jgi:membrane associated rhomboid family serine protease